MPYFQSREDYILWELSDKGYFSNQLYYKFFPHFKEKRIGDWKTIPSKNNFIILPGESLQPIPFKVKLYIKKGINEKEKKKRRD